MITPQHKRDVVDLFDEKYKIYGDMHISKSAVKMRLKRGRDYLKFELEGQDYEPARI